MNVRRRNPLQKGIRDYIVPIVGVLLILILIFSLFSGDDNSSNQVEIENKVGLEVILNSPSSESYIVYPGENKVKVEGDISLYKGEGIIVKEGSSKLSLLGLGDFNLNKLAELSYLENGNFSLESGEVWLNSTSENVIDLKFARVSVGANSHISFSQNEMGSTIYLVNGFAEVENLAGESTVLASGQQITISRLDANNEDIDLSLQKSNIDDYYKQSDWFIANNGSFYMTLESDSEEETGTGTTISSNVSTNQLISFSNLFDESNVSSDTISIAGNFQDSEITKIVLNGKEASIDSENNTFKFENVSVSSRENDLVFKVYDDANDLLSKFVYIVYNDAAGVSSNQTGGFTVQTFDVDGSQFQFTTIKDGVNISLNGKTSYSTTGDFLTIYGSVTADGIANVSVNGYTLQSFNGSTWRYHPSVINNNLSVGTNVYEVKYYNAEGTVVYTNHFTIIKKEEVFSSTTTTSTETETYSDEATIN